MSRLSISIPANGAQIFPYCVLSILTDIVWSFCFIHSHTQTRHTGARDVSPICLSHIGTRASGRWSPAIVSRYYSAVRRGHAWLSAPWSSRQGGCPLNVLYPYEFTVSCGESNLKLQQVYVSPNAINRKTRNFLENQRCFGAQQF